MALTAKQKAFVQEYLVDLNATQAARRAGYKNPEIGRQLITNNNVSSAIQAALKAREKRTEVTQDYVIAKLREIVEKDASDGPDSELKYANKIRALELLGKHTGAFDARVSAAAQDVVEDDPITKSLKEEAQNGSKL